MPDTLAVRWIPAVLGLAAAVTPAGEETVPIGALEGGGEARAARGADGTWGIEVRGAGLAAASCRTPVLAELREGDRVIEAAAGYGEVLRSGEDVVGRGSVAGPGGSRLSVEDRWTVAGGALRVERTLTVHGDGPGGFVSGILLALDRPLPWTGVEWFVPGMVYGGFDHLTAEAIGGRGCHRPGSTEVRIREDRLPAPLLGARLDDGSSIAVLDPSPDGRTTAADSRDVEASAPIVDERLRFGAVAARERGGHLEVGSWFPGTEGPITYAGNTYPGGQLRRWRVRLHPLRNGLVQSWRGEFRFGWGETFPAFLRGAWRWAWDRLRPRAPRQDIAAARRCLADHLAGRVETAGDRTAIAIFADAVRGGPALDRNALLGFCGKNLEAAEMLLAEGARDPGARGERLRGRAEAVIGTFLRLKVDPPEGEGFALDGGRPVSPIGNQVFLRSLTDDAKALLRACRRERAAGRDRPEWIAWARRYGDWLLSQERPGGGYSRSWEPGTGKVRDASPRSSFEAVPLLVLLTELTGAKGYLEAACRAGEFSWGEGQSRGRFVGGTIDNPDVIDKEAGTLSLEAYLALHGATGDGRWLDRAAAAAAFAETWIYLWDVPMPDDEDPAALPWKRGVPTAGLQLIATGHSLVDAYMAFDVDEFARLGKLAGDAHSIEVARLLLHGTKGMLALPGRTHDLAGAGWQQEHWSLAPIRGFGLHRGWLPWVSTSQLNGIIGLEELDPALFRDLCEG